MRTTRPFTLALLVAGLLAAVFSAPAGAEPYQVVDALGRILGFDSVPARIVVAGRATLLLVDAVYLFPGAGKRIVGVGVTDQGLGDVLPLLDPEWRSKVRFGNNAGPEQLAALKPDLVILKTSMKQTVGDTLGRLAIPVLYLDLESPEAFRRDVRSLGDLFRDPGRARLVERWYDDRVAAVTRSVAGAPRSRALLLSAGAQGTGSDFSIPPAGWIQTWMVGAAGGDPVWREANIGAGWSKVGLEQIAAWKPDHVFVVSYQEPATAAAEKLRASGYLDAAVRPFPADFVSWDQSDTRWILGLQWMATALHPDRFPGFDLSAEVEAFYRELYGLDSATIRSQLMPRLGAVGEQR